MEHKTRGCFSARVASPHRIGSSDSSLSYWSLNVLAKKKMTPEATSRNPATEAMAMPTTSGSDTYSSQCSPLYHQFSPTRHLLRKVWELWFFLTSQNFSPTPKLSFSLAFALIYCPEVALSDHVQRVSHQNWGWRCVQELVPCLYHFWSVNIISAQVIWVSSVSLPQDSAQ